MSAPDLRPVMTLPAISRKPRDFGCKTLFQNAPKGKPFVHGPYRAVLGKPCGDPLFPVLETMLRRRGGDLQGEASEPVVAILGCQSRPTPAP